ncbi:adenylate/guanylate cyclase domain-containing protein [Planktothrix pseudagardhii]|uniref:Adenylate cyclase n=1 Tax=Planktothrix pseudagardhii TaxID=132604 RepID=A0A9W4GC37_9CYAN|nr:adenylate/guanylate cyclase domain-containing protein [Planktothrix pseudagardhii]CAD5986098.1 Adenylate cyclase [Planktothrix pseudagardhii]
MTTTDSRLSEIGAFIQTNLKKFSSNLAPTKAQTYDDWRKHFLYQRLSLGFTLALISYFTFTLSQINNFFFDPDHFQPSWLATQVVAELGLIIGLVLLRTPLGMKYPGLMFLLLSWVVTITPQIRENLNGIATASIIEWPLMFFSQATLIPVYWPLHLISQLGVLIYYHGSQILFNLKLVLPAPWMTAEFLSLYLFWICLICNLSVYLYDRLARSEFKSRQALEKAYDLVKEEQERSESLLLNILPHSIAQRLKLQPSTIADSFTDAGVLFADIVGFTELSGQFNPAELVNLLNQIFSEFDHLAELHGLEKIKTIGDSYMVVSGLPIPHDDYAQAIAAMALDMQRTLKEFNVKTQQNFHIRIGIATGPVVAGVIGIKKFIYDLWGDTVNLASRMESHGLTDEIQVTETTYLALKEQYLFEKRGTILVKGKGEMTTYLLKGKKTLAVSTNIP